MSPELIGCLGIVALVILMFLGFHISVVMAVVGFVGLLLVAGSTAAFGALFIVPFARSSDFNFAVIPLFILMSEFVSEGAIAKQAFVAVRAWIGQVRGGLALASLGAATLLAATSGSSLACALIMGRIAYPEMMKSQYDSKLASGVIAAGGTIGSMIPPSIPFIVIGVVTDQSIGKLFMAGILPGFTQALFYIATVVIMCKFNPSLGPKTASSSLREKVFAIKLTWPIVLLFVIVMGGIYMGVFTATEAAAVGAFGALLIGISQRNLNSHTIYEALKRSVKTGGMLLFIIIAVMILNKFLGLSRIPLVLSESVAAMGIDKYVILTVILIFYIIVGCFFDIMAVLILTLPILFPTVIALGFNPIWYSVLMCRTVEMGFITPPFGLNLFGLNGVIGIPMQTLFKGVLPFIIADCFHVVLLVLVSSLALVLPDLMR